MVQELDESFSALVFVGYHSAATAGGHPLGHTFSNSTFSRLELNGDRLSEFRVNSLTGRNLGVPSVFVSGDEGLCEEAHGWEPEITAFATMRGLGRSTISVHPEVSIQEIRAGVSRAVSNRQSPEPMPERFCLDIRYREHMNAYRFSFYPGAEAIADDTVRFETDTWFEVLRTLRFAR
jgi:D-amino peptidase